MRLLKGRLYEIKGKLSYGRRFLSFIFLSLTAFIVVYTIVYPFIYEATLETYNPIAGFLVAIFPLVAGTVIGTRRNFSVDSHNKKIYLNKAVASIVYSKNTIFFDSLSYVSVFRNYTEHYEGRLFYNTTQYVNLFEIKNQDEVVQWVHRISDALSIPVNNLIIDDHWEDKKAPFVEPKEREISVFLSEGSRPIWQSIIAALCYTFSVVYCYYFALIWVRNDFQAFDEMQGMVELVVLSAGMGVGFSLVRDYLFDFKNNHYKRIFRIGPIRYGTWKTLRRMEYISVYRKRLGEIQILLWYNKSKHFKLGAYGEKSDALAVAEKLALKFGLDIYNNTDGEACWIYFDDLTEDKSTPTFALRLHE